MSNQMPSDINGLIRNTSNIRNVVLCENNNEINNAITHFILTEHENSYSSHFDERIRGPKVGFSLGSKIQIHNEEKYLINLINSPSYIVENSFDLCIRPVDGAVIVVSAISGFDVMDEYVLAKLLTEGIKPIFFINHLNHLIKKSKFTSKELEDRLNEITDDINRKIGIYADIDQKTEWQVDLNDGGIIFGSIFHNIGFDIELMDERGMDFDSIIEHFHDDNIKAISEFPIYKVLTKQIIEQLPSPDIAQRYRISKIWTGDILSPEGQTMVNASSEGPFLGVMILGSLCRVYGGCLKKGDEILIAGEEKSFVIEKMTIPNVLGMDNSTILIRLNISREELDIVPAGNIVIIDRIDGVDDYKTICLANDEAVEDISLFETVEDIHEKTVLFYVDPEDSKDLGEVFVDLESFKEHFKKFETEFDFPNGKVWVFCSYEEYIRNLVYYIRRNVRANVNISKPMAIYKARITSKAGPVETRSPNKQNIFQFEIEPLDESISDDEELADIWDLHNGNMLLNMTDGVKNINEMKPILIHAFEEAIDEYSQELVELNGLKFKLLEARFHEDPVHRGPAQIFPAIKDPLKEAINLAGVTLMEPIRTASVSTLRKHFDDCLVQIKNWRGIVLDSKFNGEYCEIKFEIPLVGIFDLEENFHSISNGKYVMSSKFKGFEKMDSTLQESIVKEIRQRK